MKTLTKKSAEAKLLKLTVSKSSIAYKLVKQVVEGAKEIRPVHINGSWGFRSNQDHTVNTTTLLDLMGIEYVLSNDSPRGGLTGTLITITTKIK